jgi:hypothetical protein
MNNPYAPPQAHGQPGGHFVAQANGKELTVSKHAHLPDVCVKCNATQQIQRRAHTFQWAPQWVYMFGGFLFLLLRKTAAMQVPLCQACNARWGKSKLAMIGAVLGFFAALVLGGMVAGAAGDVGGILFLVFLLLGVGGLIAVAVAVVKPAQLQVKKIDNQVIVLAGVDPGAANSIARIAAGG